MEILSIKLPNAVIAQLDNAARRRRRSRAALVREAVRAYLNPIGNGMKRTALDLAGDLVGSLCGSGDLSFNKAHLEGFGGK